MELRHLRYFQGVAEALSFTKAAQALRVAQPALSRQIRQLEDELGVKLLERNARRVALTEAGRAFLKEASVLLKQSEQAVRVAQQIGRVQGGELNLGYVWGLFHSLVPPLLEQFRSQSPGTAMHLFDLSAVQQAEFLKAGRLDAGFIGFAHEADAAGLRKLKVGTCRFVAALPADHRAARRALVSLGALRDDFFLGISEQTYPGASHHVLQACEQAGFRPRILQMVERGYTILGLVAGKCGVALVPESLKALPHAGIIFRSLTDPVIADLFLAWRDDPPPAPLAEFLQLLSRSFIAKTSLRAQP